MGRQAEKNEYLPGHIAVLNSLDLLSKDTGEHECYMGKTRVWHIPEIFYLFSGWLH